MARMKPMRLVVAAALAVLSFDVGHALFTHNSVGALEWVVGAAVVVLLALIAASYGRRSFRRTSIACSVSNGSRRPAEPRPGADECRAHDQSHSELLAE